MTLVFQIAAILVIAIAGYFIFRGAGARHLAMRRVLLLLFIVVAASSVFFPQILTWVANLLGIGRGADLLLYFMVLIFIGFVATTYRRFRQFESEITHLTRQLALQNVLFPDAENGLPSASERCDDGQS